MNRIDIPEDKDDLQRLIENYFYGCFPNYQIPVPNGKQYRPYYCWGKWKRADPEPVPYEITSEQVEGEAVWGTRAADGDWAHFAALDVDTTDESLLKDLEAALDRTYGPIYNWERSGSGVHVWFCWEGKTKLSIAKAFIELLQVPAKPKKLIDIRYPSARTVLRLPFPCLYDPVPHFRSNEIIVLSQEDIHEVLGRNAIEVGKQVGECHHPCADNELNAINDLIVNSREEENLGNRARSGVGRGGSCREPERPGVLSGKRIPSKHQVVSDRRSGEVPTDILVIRKHLKPRRKRAVVPAKARRYSVWTPSGGGLRWDNSIGEDRLRVWLV